MGGPGSGEKSSSRNFHPYLPHKKQQDVVRDVPKGSLAIKVVKGRNNRDFVVLVIYFNQPLFMQLLKEADEEHGFDQKGTMTIPCHVEEFRNVQGVIDREKSSLHHDNHHHHHHQYHIGCFRIW